MNENQDFSSLMLAVKRLRVPNNRLLHGTPGGTRHKVQHFREIARLHMNAYLYIHNQRRNYFIELHEAGHFLGGTRFPRYTGLVKGAARFMPTGTQVEGGRQAENEQGGQRKGQYRAQPRR